MGRTELRSEVLMGRGREGEQQRGKGGGGGVLL